MLKLVSFMIKLILFMIKMYYFIFTKLFPLESKTCIENKGKYRCNYIILVNSMSKIFWESLELGTDNIK